MLIIDAIKKIDGLAYKFGLPVKPSFSKGVSYSIEDETGKAKVIYGKKLMAIFIWEPTGESDL